MQQQPPNPEYSSPMRLRVVLLGLAVVISAVPLVWFSLDESAGETLLKWTNSSYRINHTNRAAPPQQRDRSSNVNPAPYDQTTPV